MPRDRIEFDQAHAASLRSLWFLGDVHGDFRHIAQALLDAPETPRWLVFLGDIDHKPFREILEPMRPGPYQWRDGERPSSMLNACIYPDDVAALSQMRADILVTHEAPSCHPHGYGALDEMARSMQVVLTFHGHHHDDLSDEYAKVRRELGFDARAVSYCSIKNGLGEVVVNGPEGW